MRENSLVRFAINCTAFAQLIERVGTTLGEVRHSFASILFSVCYVHLALCLYIGVVCVEFGIFFYLWRVSLAAKRVN